MCFTPTMRVMWATSPNEKIIKGDEVTFTVHIKNTRTDKSITEGVIGIWGHEEGGEWWTKYGTITGINEDGVVMGMTTEDDSESHEVFIPYGAVFHLSLIIDEEDLHGHLMLPMKFRRLENSDHVLVLPSCASYATLSVTGAERITWKYPSCNQ